MKNPWYAVLLSYFLPGLGHLYAGRLLRGAFIAILFLAFLFSAWYLILSPCGDLRQGLWLMLGVMLIYVFALVDSHRTARRSSEGAASKGGKDPWLAGFLSYVFPGVALPGLGQIYGKKPLAGVLFIAAGGGLLAASLRVGALAMALHHVLRFGALWHAQWSIGSGRRAFSRPLLLLIPLALAEGAVGNFGVRWAFENVVTPVTLAGDEMAPALQANDLVLVERCSYRSREPRRDEIVMYQEEGAPILFGRVVGLPGEEVQVSGGKLRVKGEPVGRLTRPVPDAEWGSINLPQDGYLIIADDARLKPEDGYPPVLRRDKILGRAYKLLLPMSRSSSLDGPTPRD